MASDWHSYKLINDSIGKLVMSIYAQKYQDGAPVYQDGRAVILTGRAAIAQRLRNALLMYREEFTLEPQLGVDWFLLREKGIGLARIQAAVRAVILADESVIRISEFDIEFSNREDRAVSISFTAQTTDGAVAIAEDL